MRERSTNPAMSPEDESLPRNNPEMLFMAVRLIAARLPFSAELQAAASLPAAH